MSVPTRFNLITESGEIIQFDDLYELFMFVLERVERGE